MVIGIQTVATVKVFDPQGNDPLNFIGCQIDDGQGVVFLQRHKGLGTVGGNGNKLRFKVLSCTGIGEDAYAVSPQVVFATVKGFKTDGGDICLGKIGNTTGYINDADGAVGVYTPIGFTLIGR